MAIAWMNGNFVDEADAAVSIRDTGLLHAAGVFTTMRAYGGVVFRLRRHLTRLRESCEALFIPLLPKDELLMEVVGEVLEKNKLADARLRLTVTRGTSQQDPLHGLRLEPNVFLTATELQAYPESYYQEGMTVVLNDEQKLNPYDIQAGYKTLNYFSRLAALRDATRRSAGEALWFNVHNYLQSGSISNVFVVKDGRLMTPPTPREMLDAAMRDAMPYPRSAVLPGITREAVMEAAKKAGIELQITAINVHQLLEADECFLTNSIMQVMPVGRVERHAFGEGRPGTVTRKLGEELARMIAGETATA